MLEIRVIVRRQATTALLHLSHHVETFGERAELADDLAQQAIGVPRMDLTRFDQMEQLRGEPV